MGTIYYASGDGKTALTTTFLQSAVSTLEQTKNVKKVHVSYEGQGRSVGHHQAEESLKNLDQSNYVFACLDGGAEIDPDVAFTIGYANARGMPIIGYRTDVRGAEPGAPVNLQVLHFIKTSGGKVFSGQNAFNDGIEFLCSVKPLKINGNQSQSFSKQDSLTVYIANQLGFRTDGYKFLENQVIKPLSEAGVYPHEPFHECQSESLKTLIKVESDDSSTLKEAKEAREKFIVETGKSNETAIKTSDLIVGLLDGTTLDSGTLSELGFAAALGRPVVTVSTKQKASGITPFIRAAIEKNQGSRILECHDAYQIMKGYISTWARKKQEEELEV